MTSAQSKSSTINVAAASILGGVAAPLPKGVEPELPTLATAPPSAQDWLHETATASWPASRRAG